MEPAPTPPGHEIDSAHRRRRWLMFLLWTVLFGTAAISNILTSRIDADRYHVPYATWHIIINEISSPAVSLMILPFLLMACDRWPLHADTWRRYLPYYIAGSALWCVLHIAGMDLLRLLGYRFGGDSYDPGNLGLQFIYEYLKDVRTFFYIVLLTHAVEWFGRQAKGEARLLVAPDDEVAPVEPIDRPERFLVRKLGRDFLVATADIEWAQASGNYVNLRVRGRDYPLRSTLAALEARLDPAVFVRAHRSYLVQLAQVTSIEPLDAGEARLHMADGTVLPCSRRYREALRAVAAGAEPVAARA
jgi:hypothetical protein